MFIVFEGIDGSGTTTQVQILTDFLRGKNVPILQTAEPTNGVIGKFIRKALSGESKISPRALQILFFADREEHLQTKILPALQKGQVVISDRYLLSTLAYASLIKMNLSPDKGELRGIALNQQNSSLFEDIAKHFLKPDITIFIDIPEKTALERIEKRGEQKEIFEKKELLEKISDSYRKNMQKIPEERKLIIDGIKPIHEISEKIQSIVLDKIHP